MNRLEHLDWCKKRALEYVDKGDLQSAVASMMGDLNKHEETKLTNPSLTFLGMMYVLNHDEEGVRRFIEGFN